VTGGPPDYTSVFDAVPVPLLVLTPGLVAVDANRAWLEARPPLLCVSLERARDTGRPDTVSFQRYAVPTPDGGCTERFWSFQSVPVVDGSGSVVLLLHRADDVTAYVREAERTRQVETELRVLGERQERTARSLAGLASTVSALAGAENRAELLLQLFRHGREALGADALAVALSEPGGSHLAVVHAGDQVDGPYAQLPVQSPLPMAVAAAGRPVFEADAGQGAASGAPVPGLRAWAALPLRAGRRPVGSLMVGWDRPHEFEEDDVGVLQAFAAQCSQAVHRVARLETERRRAHVTRGLAETLQRSLLTEPPRPADLDIAVRYRPATQEAQVGGDWYDAFCSPGGPVTLVVGDVTGHDWTSAAIAGQLRNMLRGIAFAFDVRAPEVLLTALDRALGATGVPTLASAVVARVEPTPGHGTRLLRWSNAGHPPPLLIHPDGTTELLERPRNLVLGVDADRPRQQHAVGLSPGATVVLYTDGLVERRDATFDDGVDRLRAAGRDLAALPVDEMCDELLLRLDPELTDDIALLVLRVRDGPDRPPTTRPA
jgi:serine phosphatase RsbU (regulator of sigma subunit)